METQSLSLEISQLRFLDIGLEDGTGNAMNSSVFSLKTMSLVMVLVVPVPPVLVLVVMVSHDVSEQQA